MSVGLAIALGVALLGLLFEGDAAHGHLFEQRVALQFFEDGVAQFERRGLQYLEGLAQLRCQYLVLRELLDLMEALVRHDTRLPPGGA